MYRGAFPFSTKIGTIPGVQFHQGSLTIKVTGSGQTYSFTYKGTIKTQGAFKAEMVFDLGFTSAGVYSGTIKVTSNGQTFTYNAADNN